MALSQPATFNEAWSDERVAGYLNHLPPAGENADFHVLYHAYKQMRPHDFERLLNLFTQAGRSLEATNSHGESIGQLIARFPEHSQPFQEVLAKFSSRTLC